jgi:hypothetical protein
MAENVNEGVESGFKSLASVMKRSGNLIRPEARYSGSSE